MRAKSPKRLSFTLFLSLSVFSIVVIICFAGAFSGLFYLSQEAEAESRLVSMAENAACAMKGHSLEEDISTLQAQFEDGVRCTLISQDGAVLFDSEGDVYADHSTRPEVIRAQERGSSSVVRHSETMGIDAVYAAVAMDGGTILRLSEERPSYLAIASSIAVPLMATVVLLGVLSLILSRKLAAHIVSPLDKIDVSQPLAHQAYYEMEPLLMRIHEQQRQLREQNDELARAENLRREFSANVSHEMKTPLQVISGYAELIKAGVADEEDIKRFAGIMSDESKHMGDLIDDILTLSRLEDPIFEHAGKESLELLAFVTQVADRLLPLAEGRGVLLRVFGSSVDMVGNKQLLEQLFANLISNAIRYSEEGGEVTVVVGKTLVTDVGMRVSEAFVRVRDTGCGIALEEQEKIFERFYRVDKSRSKQSGGTGLGLAIAKHAAAFHKGIITVESEMGEGSTFTARFPLDDNE